MTAHGRLVIADDDPDIRELLALNFTAEGFEVLTSTNGLEAETMVRAERPDLVILDGMMPERDGLEVLASLKSDPDTRDIPVVLLTARATDADIWEGWRLRTDYYLTKPFDLDHLVHYVRYLIGGEHRLT